MFVVTGQPPIRPNRCAVLPQLVHISVSPDERYVDTCQDIWDDRIYVSETAVKEMAKLLGFPTREDHTVALAQRDAALDTLERVREERNELRREIEAIDYLGSKDFIARKKVGRPKQPTTKAA